MSYYIWQNMRIQMLNNYFLYEPSMSIWIYFGILSCLLDARCDYLLHCVYHFHTCILLYVYVLLFFSTQKIKKKKIYFVHCTCHPFVYHFMHFYFLGRIYEQKMHHWNLFWCVTGQIKGIKMFKNLLLMYTFLST